MPFVAFLAMLALSTPAPTPTSSRPNTLPTDCPNDEVRRVGGTVTEPVEVSRVQPDYSAEARKQRLEGTVILEAIIRADGTVTNVQVLRGIHRLLDEPSLEAVRRWRYKPALLNGIPVCVYLTITTKFSLPVPTPRPRPEGTYVGNWQVPGSRHWLVVMPDGRALQCSIGRDDAITKTQGSVRGARITWKDVWPPQAMSRIGPALSLTPDDSEGDTVFEPLDAYVPATCGP